MTNRNIEKLKEARSEALRHYRKQRDAYTSEFDELIRLELVQLTMNGATTAQLQDAIGSKDYRTLRFYLDHVPLKPPEPPLRAPQAPRAPRAEVVGDAVEKPVAYSVDLIDYLSFHVEDRLITATDVPRVAWSTNLHKRPDLMPDFDGYSGWARYDKHGRITERSETNSPLLGEQKYGVLTPQFILENDGAHE